MKILNAFFRAERRGDERLAITIRKMKLKVCPSSAWYEQREDTISTAHVSTQ